MNVSGLATSIGSTPYRLATNISGTCAGARAIVNWCRRAISSATRNPTLWRVSRYSRPGFPRPTMSFMPSGGSEDPLPLRLLAFLVGLALLDDLGLRCWRGGRRVRIGRCRRLLSLRQDDVHEHRLGLVERLPLRVGRQVAQPDGVVQIQFRDIDLDALRDVGRQ